MPVLVLAGRTVMGMLLAVVLSVIGIGIAWGVFVFFGAASHATLILLFMSGAGLGAALGGYIAWIRVDRTPPRSVVIAMASALVLAGIGGAWGGFQFGANQEIECCVGPAITPITYTAMGATLGANVAALLMGVAHEINVRRGWAKFPPAAAGSTAGPSSEARRFPR